MFRKNKIEKEYIRRAENLQIPKINGEQFIKINSTENKNIFKFPKYMVRVACICTIIIFSTVGINYFNYKNNEENNVISTGFSIEAYAATTDGTKSVELIENQIVELPSVDTKYGGFNMKDLEINVGKKIRNLKTYCTNGSVNLFLGSERNELGESVTLIGNEQMVIIEKGLFSEKDTDTIKYVGDEVIKILIEKFENGESVDENIRKIEHCEYDDLINNNIENFPFVNYSDNYSMDLDITSEESKFIISWMPKIEVLKMLSQKDIEDFSKLEGDSIKIQVTFEDGTVKENTLNLSFNKEGNIIFELK